MTITCGIFLVSKDQKVLVGKSHGSNRRILYSIPKGKVEEGETHRQAALRELFEEANIDIKNWEDRLKELPSVKYKNRKKTLKPFYIFDIDREMFSQVKCNAYTEKGIPEFFDLEWIDLEECRTALHPSQQVCIEKIIEIKNEIVNNNNIQSE